MTNGAMVTFPERSTNSIACSEAVRFVQHFHRAPDSTVSLIQKNTSDDGESTLAALGNIKPEDCSTTLFRLWPEIVKTDCYMTISSVYGGARILGENATSGLPVTRRRVKELQHLNSSWVDLDTYKTGMDAETVFPFALNCFLEAAIPLPTVALFSGRGLWFFWTFTEPVRAYSEKCDLLSRVNGNLVSRVNHLGGDIQSRDAARICRLPGTINSKSGKRVYFREIPGSSPVDMMQFALQLGVPARSTSLDGERVKKHRDLRNPAKSRAGYARWQTRRADLLQILESRGKIKQGGDGQAGRREFLFLLSAVSMKAGMKGLDIRREIFNFGQTRCFPPLSDSHIESVLTSGLRARRNISDETIRKHAAIVPGEIESLKLNLGRVKREQRVRTKSAEIQDRRKAILEIQESGITTCRAIAESLKLRGFCVSRSSVSVDLKAVHGNIRGGGSSAAPTPLLSASRDASSKSLSSFVLIESSLPLYKHKTGQGAPPEAFPIQAQNDTGQGVESKVGNSPISYENKQDNPKNGEKPGEDAHNSRIRFLKSQRAALLASHGGDLSQTTKQGSDHA